MLLLRSITGNGVTLYFVSDQATLKRHIARISVFVCSTSAPQFEVPIPVFFPQRFLLLWHRCWPVLFLAQMLVVCSAWTCSAKIAVKGSWMWPLRKRLAPAKKGVLLAKALPRHPKMLLLCCVEGSSLNHQKSLANCQIMRI